MRALWRHNAGTQSFKDVDEPNILEPNDVKIKVAYNTIGIQDLRMLREWDLYAKQGIAGYEMAGEIVEVGEEAALNGLHVGERVTGTIIDFCGSCKYCLNGQEQYCMQMRIRSGTLCDYVVWKAEQIIAIPEDMSYDIGTLIEPVAVVLMAAKKMKLSPEHRLCIFGADFNGLVLLQIAKLYGVKDVTVIEPKEWNREMAKKLGADNVYDVNDELLSTKLLAATDFTGFETVAMTSSNSSWIKLAGDIVAAVGMIIFTVYYDYETEIGINSVKLFRMGINITSSLLYTKKVLYESAELVKSLKLKELIVETYSFEETLEAFESEKRNLYPRIGIGKV